MPVATAAKARRRRRAALRVVGVALAASVLGAALPGVLAPVPRAEAAVIGHMVSIGGWDVGAFLSSNGEIVYCIEPGSTSPRSDQLEAEIVDELPAYTQTFPEFTGWNAEVSSGPLSGEKLRQINYLLWEHGRTTDPGVAAVVQIAIWMVRDDPGARAWLEHHLTWLRTHGGGGYVDHAAQLAAEAAQQAVPVAAPVPSDLVIQRDPAAAGPHGEFGGSVGYPAGTTELRITGATFADGSQRVTIADGAAGELPWRAVPHDPEWEGSHEVVVTATWKWSGEEWADQVRLFNPSEAGQQRLAAGVGKVPVTAERSLVARDREAVQAAPGLSTQVPERFVQPGEAFSDTVTIAGSAVVGVPAEAGSDGEADGGTGTGSDAGTGTGSDAGWPTRATADGATEYLPIVAVGTIYGPFDTPQPRSEEVPEDAPIAGSATLVATSGPGTYRVDSDVIAEASGYYSWVWRISEEDQQPDVRASGILASEYRFADDFAQSDEVQVVPGALRWDTALTEQQLAPDRLVVQDRVVADAAAGAWLKDENGEYIPARLRLTVYQEDDRPMRSAEAPDDAVELASVTVDVRAPGEAVTSEEVALPEGTRGWISVRTCLVASDQPEDWAGYAQEWCDDYGIPQETAEIVVPEALSTTGLGVDPLRGTGGMIAAALLLGGGSLGAVGVGRILRGRGTRNGRFAPRIRRACSGRIPLS